MGVKSIKEKYRIGHIVQVRGGNICVGSPYVHDIIVISPDGKLIRVWEKNSSNSDLNRYVKEMTADENTGELKRLFHQKDTFGKLFPVYTTKGGYVVKTFCEKYGYPNVTIDGELMYENTFFDKYSDAKKYLIKDTKLGVKHSFRNFIEILIDSIGRIAKSAKYLFGNIRNYIISRTINSIIWLFKKRN